MYKVGLLLFLCGADWTGVTVCLLTGCDNPQVPAILSIRNLLWFCWRYFALRFLTYTFTELVECREFGASQKMLLPACFSLTSWSIWTHLKFIFCIEMMQLWEWATTFKAMVSPNSLLPNFFIYLILINYCSNPLQIKHRHSSLNIVPLGRLPCLWHVVIVVMLMG